MIDINELADYFILKADTSSGDVMTHLKLQKLAYYAQAWHLAIYDEPLVEDDFEAWAHGPVAPRLFSRFADFSYNPIPDSCVSSKRIDSDDTLEHLQDVWTVYGGFSAKSLEDRTHSELPWIEARGECAPLERCNTTISRTTMREFYGKQLDNGQEQKKA